MISSKCTLTIDLEVIKNNYQALQKRFTGSSVGAAVKANCYGLGIEKIAPVLKAAGCKHFFVANKDEGVILSKVLNTSHRSKNSVISSHPELGSGFCEIPDQARDDNYPHCHPRVGGDPENNNRDHFANIYVLNGYFTGDKKDFVKHNLIPILNSLRQVELWSDLAQELSKKLPCFLHINTGMNRYGMSEKEVESLLKGINLNKIDILCVMSHLSSSEEPNDPANAQQLEKFKLLASLFPDAKKSLVNSSGIFLDPCYHFDIARPGVALYGVNPTPYLKESVIKNPLTIMAPIIQLNHMNVGEYIGYNRTYQANENRVIATIPLGYADGYPRSLSNKGIVFINDKPALVIGRISMDLTNIDVTDIPEEDLFLGQKVEVVGPNISFDKIASLAGTNGYELLTMLGKRYKRVYTS